MNGLVQWASHHQVIATWLVTTFLSALLGSMPAPTKTSPALYQFIFTFVNLFIGNLMRALNTKVESSPNFQDAVVKLNGNAAEAAKGN